MHFYVSPKSIFLERNIIEIRDKAEVHHIRDVMRLKKDTTVHLFDGQGREYSGDIKEMRRDTVIIKIRTIADIKDNIPYKVTLYQAIPKRDKMDFIVEKAVELGVDTIVPMLSERTAPILKEKGHKKIERWMRIVRAASKQCGRVNLPIISDIANFNDALIESKKSDMVIFAALDKDAEPLKTILEDSSPKRIAVFVGPEGDFSQNEIAMAKGRGYDVCSLGSSVLRVETAAIYILSCLSYEYSK